MLLWSTRRNPRLETSFARGAAVPDAPRSHGSPRSGVSHKCLWDCDFWSVRGYGLVGRMSSSETSA